MTEHPAWSLKPTAWGRNTSHIRSTIQVTPETVEHHFDTASVTWRNVIDFDASPDEVWEVLSDQRMWTHLWPQSDVKYYSSHRGIGALRDFVWAWGLEHQDERFLHWDDDARSYTYFAEACNLPVFGLWLENYTLSELPDGRTRLHWTAAFTPRYLSWLDLNWSQFFTRPIVKYTGWRTIQKELDANRASRAQTSNLDQHLRITTQGVSR